VPKPFPNQQLPAWIAAHCQAYAYYGGVPKVTTPSYVPRNMIRKHCKGDAGKVRIAGRLRQEATMALAWVAAAAANGGVDPRVEPAGSSTRHKRQGGGKALMSVMSVSIVRTDP
jgi:hypothetical protein